MRIEKGSKLQWFATIAMLGFAIFMAAWIHHIYVSNPIP